MIVGSFRGGGVGNAFKTQRNEDKTKKRKEKKRNIAYLFPPCAYVLSLFILERISEFQNFLKMIQNCCLEFVFNVHRVF